MGYFEHFSFFLLTIPNSGGRMNKYQELTGYEAIKAKEGDPSLRLCKYQDPVEDAREDLTLAEARDIASEDPSLIFTVVADWVECLRDNATDCGRVELSAQRVEEAATAMREQNWAFCAEISAAEKQLQNWRTLAA